MMTLQEIRELQRLYRLWAKQERENITRSLKEREHRPHVLYAAAVSEIVAHIDRVEEIINNRTLHYL